MSLPPNKYDDSSSNKKIHGNVIDTTPYRNVLLDILKGILQAYSKMLEPSYSSLPPNNEDFITAKLHDDFLDNDNFTKQFNLGVIQKIKYPFYWVKPFKSGYAIF